MFDTLALLTVRQLATSCSQGDDRMPEPYGSNCESVYSVARGNEAAWQALFSTPKHESRHQCECWGACQLV